LLSKISERPVSLRVGHLRGRTIHDFRQELLSWFDEHKRDLPWRKDRDPYRVWISEIMLQQTRVAAVVEHYHKFLGRFPTMEALATARESSVLAVWSGLGYYRRARMLHAAARKIVRELEGKFPKNSEALQELPGIGRYTSAAIASIAFGEAVPVVDGNVERVLQRVSGKQMGSAEIWKLAGTFLDEHRPGDFNQAAMELGATICLPKQPKCRLCPVAGICVSRGELRGNHKVVPQKKREIRYGLDCRNGSVFLVRRDKKASLMPGMWELPEIPAEASFGPKWRTFRHSITVTDYLVHIVNCELPEGTEGKWITKSRVASLPLTGLARKVLRAAKVI